MELITGLKTYTSGQKKNWRRRCWNIGKKGVSKFKPVELAISVYLAGAGDEDRPVACSKGFSPNNLFAIDTSDETISNLKGQGKLAVNEYLHNILLTWPVNHTIDFLFADLCGGMTSVSFSTCSSIIASSGLHRDSVVAVNLMRGRESGKSLEAIKKIRSVWKNPDGSEIMHRGLLFYCQYVSDIVNLGGGENSKHGEWWLKNHNSIHMPEFLSYKGDGCKVRMDTVIFRRGYQMEGTAKDLIINSWNDHPKYQNKLFSIQRKLRATLATQTKRKTGKLPHSPHF